MPIEKSMTDFVLSIINTYYVLAEERRFPDFEEVFPLFSKKHGIVLTKKIYGNVAPRGIAGYLANDLRLGFETDNRYKEGWNWRDLYQKEISPSFKKQESGIKIYRQEDASSQPLLEKLQLITDIDLELVATSTYNYV